MHVLNIKVRAALRDSLTDMPWLISRVAISATAYWALATAKFTLREIIEAIQMISRVITIVKIDIERINIKKQCKRIKTIIRDTYPKQE